MKKNQSSLKKKLQDNQIVAFLRSVKVELGLVKWPNRQETLRLTTIVIVVSIIMGLYVGGLDYLFTTLLTTLITK